MHKSISTSLPNDVQIYNTVEEFDNNLPDTVTLLTTANGSKVYLIGTAHFSIQSQDDVSLVMRNVKPDILVLELCPLRLHILQYDEQTLLKAASELTPARKLEIIKENGLSNGLFYIQFLNTSANITKQLGIAPGGECRRALAESMTLRQCSVYLGDRSISITMQRAMNSLSFTERLTMTLYSLIAGFSKRTTKITLEDVEKYKKKYIFEDDMKVSSEFLPSIYTAFVRERDLILSHSLETAALSRLDPLSGKPKPINVVGVVGIGHTPGIIENWGKVTSEQVADFLTIPKPKVLNRMFSHTARYTFIAFGMYGIYQGYKNVLNKE